MFRMLHAGSEYGLVLLSGIFSGDKKKGKKGLINALSGIGGCYAKWAQSISYDEPGNKSFNENIPIDEEGCKTIFREYLSKNCIDLETVEIHPNGKGSIGAVFVCHHPTETTISTAVKVQYPGIEKMINDDFKAFTTALSLTDMVTGGTNCKFLAALKDEMLSELDFAREADMGVKIRILATNAQLSTCVPRYFPSLGSKTILVCEFVNGEPMSNIMSTAAQEQKEKFAKELFHFNLFLFFSGLLLGDPHWGNFIVDKEGGVHAIDFGSVTVMSIEDTYVQLLLLNESLPSGRRSTYNDILKANWKRLTISEGTPTSADINAYHRLHSLAAPLLLSSEPIEYVIDNISDINNAGSSTPTIMRGGVSFLRSTIIMCNVLSACKVTFTPLFLLRDAHDKVLNSTTERRPPIPPSLHELLNVFGIEELTEQLNIDS